MDRRVWKKVRAQSLDGLWGLKDGGNSESGGLGDLELLSLDGPRCLTPLTQITKFPVGSSGF